MTKKGKSSFSLSPFSFFLFYKRSQTVFFINSSSPMRMKKIYELLFTKLRHSSTIESCIRIFNPSIFPCIEIFNYHLALESLLFIHDQFHFTVIFNTKHLTYVSKHWATWEKKVVTRPTYIDREHLIFTTRSRSFSRGENRGGGSGTCCHVSEKKGRSLPSLFFSSLRFGSSHVFLFPRDKFHLRQTRCVYVYMYIYIWNSRGILTNR